MSIAAGAAAGAAAASAAALKAGLAAGSKEAYGVSDMFLKFDPPIASGAGQGNHKDWIEIMSFSWGEAVGGGGQAGSELRAGGVAASDFTFSTKAVTKASPELFYKCATGAHFNGVQFERVRGGGLGSLETTIKLTDVLISSYQVGGTQGGDWGETFTLNFSKMSYKFQSFDARSGKALGGAVETTFDMREQK